MPHGQGCTEQHSHSLGAEERALGQEISTPFTNQGSSSFYAVSATFRLSQKSDLSGPSQPRPFIRPSHNPQHLSHYFQMGNPKVWLPRGIAQGSNSSSNPNSNKLCLQPPGTPSPSRHQHWQEQGSAPHTGHSVVLAVLFRQLGWGAILPTQEAICKKINNNNKNPASSQIPSLLAWLLSPKANPPDKFHV